MSATRHDEGPRILVAPDSFKGSLSAEEAARAIANGVRRAAPDAFVDLCPMADGGEGTLDVLLAAKGGTERTVTVTGPMGGTVSARWGSLSDGLAVVEAAEAVGLELVPTLDRDPTRASTFGVGELVRGALDSGARSVMIALGGTATMDIGSGLAQALGVEFDGGTRPMTGAALADVRRIRVDGVDPRLRTVTLLVATDVSNPLLGPDGAARVYGPQKGASPDQIDAIELAFAHVSRLIGDAGLEPGDGAAGGAAFLLRTLLGARVVEGASLVMNAVRFDERLEGIDLVLTGEGRLDGQTARGKVVGAVGRAARARRVPVVGLAGAIGDDARSLHAMGVDAWFSLCDRPLDEHAARANAAALLENLAENGVRLRFR